MLSVAQKGEVKGETIRLTPKSLQIRDPLKTFSPLYELVS